MSPRFISLLAVSTGLALAVAAPASARPAPPDQPAATAGATASSPPSVSLRSPDAVAAEIAARDARTAAAAPVDLRSPDARDAARGIDIQPVILAPIPVASVAPESDGFQWGDAAIGGAALLGLLGLLGGLTMMGVHYRRTHGGSHRGPIPH